MVCVTCDELRTIKMALPFVASNREQLEAFPRLSEAYSWPKSATGLDHCYTSHPAFIANTSVLNIGLADHLPLTIQRKYAKQRRGCESEHTTISYRETKNLNLDELLQSLERSLGHCIRTWRHWWYFECPGEYADEFLDQHLPWKNRRVKRRNQPPWMNVEII